MIWFSNCWRALALATMRSPLGCTRLRKLYGRSSEKVSNNQLVLAFSELQAAVPEVLDVQDTNASENDSSKGTNAHGNQPHPSPKPKSGSQHKGHGRCPLPDLPRELTTVAASPDERICSACGHERHPDGARRESYIEFRPASFYILDIHREGLKCCARAGWLMSVGANYSMHITSDFRMRRPDKTLC